MFTLAHTPTFTSAPIPTFSKMACFAVGGLFVLFQSAAYAGFIDIHWNKIEEKMEEVGNHNRELTPSTDGQMGGRIDQADGRVGQTDRWADGWTDIPCCELT